MDRELQQLRSIFASDNIRIDKCGIGKVNAALGAQQLINEFHPDCIISSGCAGGNGDGIEVGDVVASTELAYHDVYCGLADDGSQVFGQVQGMPARFQANPDLLAKARAIGVKSGLFVTGDWFVDTQGKMQTIVDAFPEAIAVDMESAAIAQTCYKHQVPFISFRVISDCPLKDHKASQYHNFWNTIADNSFLSTRKFIESL